MEAALQRQAERYLGAAIFPFEWDNARISAERKLTRIIERDGDENGARREPWYLAQLVAEAVAESRFSATAHGPPEAPLTGQRKKGVKKDGPCPKT